MAETDGQSGQTNGNNGGEGNANGGKGIENDDAGGAKARPDHIPENFWDAEKGTAKVDDLAKGYSDLSKRLSQGKAATRKEVEADLTKELTDKLKPEIAKTIEAERLAARPKDPALYEVAIPEDGDLKKAVDEAGLVFLTEQPGDDFQAEDGKAYFVMDETNPLLQWWRGMAHKMGAGQDTFMEGIVAYAKGELAIKPGPEALETARAETYKALGEHGKDRYDFARSRLVGQIGEDAANLLWSPTANPSAKGVEAIEAILARMGEPTFSPELHAVAGKTNDELLAEAAKLQASPEYAAGDKKAHDRVQEIYRRVYGAGQAA